MVYAFLDKEGRGFHRALCLFGFRLSRYSAAGAGIGDALSSIFRKPFVVPGFATLIAEPSETTPSPTLAIGSDVDGVIL